jgi:hypothetical protein
MFGAPWLIRRVSRAENILVYNDVGVSPGLGVDEE